MIHWVCLQLQEHCLLLQEHKKTHNDHKEDSFSFDLHYFQKQPKKSVLFNPRLPLVDFTSSWVGIYDIWFHWGFLE